MERRPRPRLVLVRGGLPRDASPPEDAPPPTLRVVRSEAADAVQADLERAIATARRIRQEIQARISRALDDPPSP